MTKLLEKVLKAVAKLPENEQDAVAEWLLNELESEREWNKSFAESEDALRRLADEALAERAKGATEPLEPDKL